MTRRRTTTAQPAEQTGRPFPPPTETSEALVEANLGLARQAAWRWSRKTGQPYDDLEAVAFMGLIRGCRRYDPQRLNPANGKPYALSTVVCPFVNGEILHHFRDRGHAVRYPSKWREAWGKVQRLIADPDVPAHEVAQQAGLSTEELDEMLASMTGTVSLDETFGADGAPPPEIDEPDRLAPLQQLVIEAWGNLHPGDASTLLAWWARPHRQALPMRQLEAFHQRLKALLQGRTLSEVLQLALPVAVPEVKPAKRPRAKRTPIVAVEPGVQMGLLAG